MNVSGQDQKPEGLWMLWRRKYAVSAGNWRLFAQSLST